MIVPPFDLLVHELSISRDSTQRVNGRVEVPGPFFLFLLRCLVATMEFDEQRYLAANPDVREAVRLGKVRNGHLHYVWQGYLEGRDGTPNDVDEKYYLEKYPDVATAIAEKKVNSAREHYRYTGIFEWRIPNRIVEDHLLAWKEVLVSTGT